MHTVVQVSHERVIARIYDTVNVSHEQHTKYQYLFVQYIYSHKYTLFATRKKQQRGKIIAYGKTHSHDQSYFPSNLLKSNNKILALLSEYPVRFPTSTFRGSARTTTKLFLTVYIFCY